MVLSKEEAGGKQVILVLSVCDISLQDNVAVYSKNWLRAELKSLLDHWCNLRSPTNDGKSSSVKYDVSLCYE